MKKKILKIVSSILGVCAFCGLSLLSVFEHKNNVKKVSADNQVTDLTGTSWLFNEVIIMTNNSTTWSVNFVSDTQTYTNLLPLVDLQTNSTTLTYYPLFSNVVYSSVNGGWVSNQYRIIDIIGGADVQTASLIEYLLFNARQIDKSQLSDLTGTSWFWNDFLIHTSSATNWDINFVSDGQNYEKLMPLVNLQDNSVTLTYYPPFPNYVYSASNGGWVNNEYRRIDIIDGTDIQSASLIEYLLANATLVYSEDWWLGYNVGYELGYATGVVDGYQTGYTAGQSDGYTSGYTAGETAGYQTGYADGRLDGYFDGNSDGYAIGYTDGQSFGYSQGYASGTLDGYYDGWNDGRTDGITTGYNNGYSVGYQDGVDSQTLAIQTAYTDGYSAGYSDAESSDSTIATIFSNILLIGMLPVDFFLRILNWEFLGINLASFVSALLSIAATVIVVRLVTGKKND